MANRASYDPRPPKGGADRLGKIAFYDFLCTTNTNESMVTEAFMDDVI